MRLFVNYPLLFLFLFICRTGDLFAQVDEKTKNAGVQLFPAGVERIFTPEVYTFMERYFQTLLSKNTVKAQLQLMKEDFVVMEVDGRAYIGTPSMGALIEEIGKATGFTLTGSGHWYEACWSIRSGKGEVRFTFPKQYDLILGMDKKELVEALCKELEGFSYTLPQEDFSPVFFQYDTLKNIYVETGGNYVLPQVVNGKYIRRQGSSYKYIFNERMGEESLCNLFLYADEMQEKKPMRLTVKGYRLSATFPYSTDLLSAYMKVHRCVGYTGMEEVTAKEYKGTVFYINRELMYKHLLHFRFPVAAFKSDTAVIEATLYPFIPINNLTTLYEDGLPTNRSK